MSAKKPVFNIAKFKAWFRDFGRTVVSGGEHTGNASVPDSSVDATADAGKKSITRRVGFQRQRPGQVTTKVKRQALRKGIGRKQGRDSLRPILGAQTWAERKTKTQYRWHPARKDSKGIVPALRDES